MASKTKPKPYTLNKVELTQLFMHVERLRDLITKYNKVLDSPTPDSGRNKSRIQRLCDAMNYRLIDIDNLKEAFPKGFIIANKTKHNLLRSITKHAYHCIIKAGADYTGTTDYRSLPAISDEKKDLLAGRICITRWVPGCIAIVQGVYSVPVGFEFSTSDLWKLTHPKTDEEKIAHHLNTHHERQVKLLLKHTPKFNPEGATL